MKSLNVCILGDYDPDMPTHRALDAAREHAAAGLPLRPSFEWVATDALDLDDLGTRFQALWVAPKSPYRDESRVLRALTRARTTGLPTFGNCAGFQFMVLELAQTVAGIPDARHAETPGEHAGPAVIHALACSLKGLTEPLSVVPGSKIGRFLGDTNLVGRYFCSYGVDPAFSPVLEAAGLVWTSRNAEGLPRSFELADHPFYLGCLFQPALDSEPDRPHPLIRGFLQEATRILLADY